MSYYNELTQQQGTYDQQLAELQAWKNLNDVINKEWTNWLDPKFTKNLDFIKQKSSEYDDIFNKRNMNAKILEEFDKKYWWKAPSYSWDTLSTALPKMNDEYNKTNAEIINKIESLWNIYWKEKQWFFDKIKSDHDALKAWVLWQAQEQTALTEWLNTRRWMWTKAMENVTKSSINNSTNASLWQINADETAQLKDVANLYNTLLSNLIQQYKSTKDKYVLEKIQNTVNILNALWKYWESVPA